MAKDISNNKAKGAPSKSQPKPSKVATKPAAAANKTEGIGIPQQVDLMWVAAIAVVAFVLGFFVHSIFASPSTTTPPINSISSSGSDLGGTSGSGAPALTEDQLQNSDGQLPSGHPNIGADTTGGTSTSTGGAVPQSQKDIDVLSGFTKAGSGGSSHGSTSGSSGKTSDVPASGSLSPDGQSVEVPAGKDPNK